MSFLQQIIQRYSLCLLFLCIFNFITLIAEPISSFSLQGFNNEINSDFNSNFALLGDAHMVKKIGSFVNLTSGSGSGFGQIVYNKPFKFVDLKSSKPVSFSTDFTFTISPHDDGDGLVFVIFPSGELSKVFDQGYFGVSDNIKGRFVGVEFDTRKDDNVGDLNGNHVGLDVGSFVSNVVSDVSSLGLVLNGGQPLRCWIDYEASSKRLEVRLGGSGSERPYQPLISYDIDLSEMWGGQDVQIGISSSSGDSRQLSSLSSWSFRTWMVRSSLHSQPLNPGDHHQQPLKQKKSGFLTVLGGLIFATGCGTLVAFFVLFLWVVFFNRHSDVPHELPLNQMEFKYEKVNVTVDSVSDYPTS